MQNNFRGFASQWKNLLVLAIALVALLAVSPHAAQAQDAEFELVRTALQEKFRVNLRPVQNWAWEQYEFTDGIESCLNPENRENRTLFFGRRYLITSLSGRVFEARVSFDQSIVIACDNVVEPQPAAAPAAAGGNLPAPAAGSANISGFALGGHVLELSAGTSSLMQRAGMTWVKKQVTYNLGDDPSGTAGIINQAHASGYKVLLGIVGRKDQMGDFNSYINSYAGFVAGVAGLGADAIEVWNEPNIDREWPAGSINGANYTQLLAAAFNAIKARNAATWVISGAPAPTGFFGAAGCGSGGCNDDTFMQQMAAAGAAQYLDCVGLHYNEGIISPRQGSGDPRGSYPSYYFGSMLQRGYGPFGGKPVCFTELGYLSGEGFSTPIPANFAWAANTTVAQHATWLAEAASAAAQSGKVRLMIVWNVDFPFYTPTDPMGGYAMQRPGGACPACDSLGAVMR
jgi:hypothetical protein